VRGGLHGVEVLLFRARGRHVCRPVVVAALRLCGGDELVVLLAWCADDGDSVRVGVVR
jgi:hypothetical protein